MKSHKAKGEVPPKEFDKYWFYRKSVQSPDADVEFIQTAYKEIRKKNPTVLCEDFCGTFDISCHWVQMDKKHKAIGVDLDKEPISYGKKNYLPRLSDEEQKRVQIFNKNVLSKDLPKADAIAALNFSYFIFKERKTLVEYLKSAHSRLEKDGVLIMDCFGGSECYEPNEEETEFDNFSYFWDQDYFDPVKNYAQFYIHFKQKGKKKHQKVFSYDWRMWSIPELRDALMDAGFSKTYVYWEGTDKDGEGDGIFTQAEEGEDCESWVAYIASVK